MVLLVEPSGQACGARVTGVDLQQPLDPEAIAEIRATWLEHHVLAFPEQWLNDDQLELFTEAMGGFGEDPFLAPLPGRKHVAAVCREADETTPIFAEGWHSDWSFLVRPPAGTCLNAVTLPPQGGDTLFANQHLAWESLAASLQQRARPLLAIHTARLPYAPDGAYGLADSAARRGMAIRPSERALEIQHHPLVQPHPETGREALFSTLGYIVGIVDMDDDDAFPLLRELHAWQGDDRFTYRHRWEPGMLLMWDNRSVLHKATGGYEGHRRELHRTTIAAWAGL